MGTVIRNVIRKMHQEKVQKYVKGMITVTPFIVTAGGSIGSSAEEVLDTLTKRPNPLNGTEQLEFQKKLFGAMSCALIRSANLHLVRQDRRSLRIGSSVVDTLQNSRMNMFFFLESKLTSFSPSLHRPLVAMYTFAPTFLRLLSRSR